MDCTMIPHPAGHAATPIVMKVCKLSCCLQCLQDMLEHAKDEENAAADQLVPHPADEKYGTLKADLQVVKHSEQEFQVVEQ